jgi:tRNA pseudouridine55 synthase
MLPYFPLEPKHYRFGIRFGSQTDTLDAEGRVVISGGAIPDAASLEAVLPQFTGTIVQVPPAYSSVKIGGVRAYRLARQGKQVSPAPRRITIDSIRLSGFDAGAGKALLDVVCSGGTYVRSLARDIAGKLGTCGYACEVRRLAAGRFRVDDALPFGEIDKAAGAVIPVSKALEGLPSTVVSGEQRTRLLAGCDITVDAWAPGTNPAPSTIAFAYDDASRLVAVVRNRGGNRYHPEKVLSAGGREA